MPVPLFKHHFCRRSSVSGLPGPKAHAHAAYLSGTKLDDGYGRTADFTPKGGILRAELWVPPYAPLWAKDRGELWRRLEAREDRTTRPHDAILAHKFIGALPHELTLEENTLYVKDFIREQFTRKGYAADWAIHAPDPGSDNRNYHVHIMVPLRKFENGDWAKLKDRFPKNSPALSQFIKGKQTAFFEMQNRYLDKNGFKAQILRADGKWTVNGVTTGRREPSKPLDSMVRASPAPAPGGTQSLTLKSAYDNMVQDAAMRNASKAAGIAMPKSTGGWPIEAITDWSAWGKKAPLKFFQKWPELAPTGFNPGGGPGR